MYLRLVLLCFVYLIRSEPNRQNKHEAIFFLICAIVLTQSFYDLFFLSMKDCWLNVLVSILLFFVVFSSHLSVAILFRHNLISTDMLSIQLRYCHCDLSLIFPLLIS